MAEKLTAAQRSLVRVFAELGQQFTERHLRMSPWLRDDFRRAKRAGYIGSAGYETTAKADDFLYSEVGRTSLTPDTQED